MSNHWNGTIAHVVNVASSAVQYGSFAPMFSTIRSYSWKARAHTTSATPSSAVESRNQMRASATTPRTTPLRTRVIGGLGLAAWGLRKSPNSGRNGRCDAAKPAIAFLVLDHAFEEVPAPEVGPQVIGDPDLGVGDLPEQKVTDAHLAARPDQQIGIGLARGVEEAREPTLIEIFRLHARLNGATRGVDDLSPAAVIERDIEQHAGILRRPMLGIEQLGLDVGRQRVGSADDVEADVVAQQRVELQTQVALEQHHQGADLGRRPLPVFDGEGVEGEHLEAETSRGLHHVAHRIDAGAMALHARQMTLAGPAAIAVHDDGNVVETSARL